MESSLIKCFPAGAAKTTGVYFGAEIGPRPDYQHYAKAHGGEGFRVTKPEEIKTAIEQALKCEKEKKLTVIDLVLSDFNPRWHYRQTNSSPRRTRKARRFGESLVRFMRFVANRPSRVLRPLRSLRLCSEPALSLSKGLALRPILRSKIIAAAQKTRSLPISYTNSYRQCLPA